MGNTIKESFELSGVGLHSGVTTTVRVVPTQAEEGRYFVRVDLPDRPIIPARIEAVSQTTLSTELACGQAKVKTVEHLLAALFGNGVDNARIEIDGAEVPLLDGSAKMWSEAIADVGLSSLPVSPSHASRYNGTGRMKGRGNLAPQPLGNPRNALAPRPPISLTEAIWIREEDTFVAALPSSETRFTYGIDFPYQAIGNQWHSWNPQTENFAEAIAPARTFGFAEAIEQLKQAGLIKGGSLENALVCSDRGWLNPPLRFTNEPARHKLLDLIGDLSLLGNLPQAHFLAYKASHKLHVQLAQKLANLVHL
jgi:UDP-3-O-[3-hydroxymyristoyl] N-acetylglucosamine deacetylase